MGGAGGRGVVCFLHIMPKKYRREILMWHLEALVDVMFDSMEHLREQSMPVSKPYTHAKRAQLVAQPSPYIGILIYFESSKL